MFLKISNRGLLPRECLEMVGLGSKRGRTDDASVIGQFGSGTKFAAAAALRAGIHTGISSSDASGSYYLSFATQDIRPEGYATHHRIVYQYFACGGGIVRSDYNYPTDRVVEAFPDWDKPIGADSMRLFKILREHLCNAYDEDKKFRWEFVKQNTFSAAGETSVHLGYDPELRMMMETKPERYFKFLSSQKAVHSDPDMGEIWPKSEPGKTRLFLLGVMVSCSNDADQTSLFDYSLRNKRMLSEERILKNLSAYRTGVSKMLAKLRSTFLTRHILNAVLDGKASFESSALGSIDSSALTPESRAAWLSAIQVLLGEKIVLSSGNPQTDNDANQVYGYVVFANASDDVRRFFTTLGIPNASEIVPKDISEDIAPVSFDNMAVEEQTKFLSVFRMFSQRFPEQAKIPVAFFRPLTNRLRQWHGFAGMGNNVFNTIWIAVNDELRLPPRFHVLETLIHEARHCATRAHDGDRAFVDKADRDLAVMIYREELYGALENGVIVAPLSLPSHPVFAGETEDPSAVPVEIVDDANEAEQTILDRIIADIKDKK